jgi:phage tape measure protein
MNIVQYGISFKDYASTQLGKFTGKLQTSMSVARQFSDKVVTLNRVHGQSFNALQQRISECENRIRNSTIKAEIRAAKRELASLQKQAAKHSGNIEGKAGGGLSVAGLMKGGLAVGAFIKAGQMAGDFFGDAMSKSLERQKIQTSFNILAGDETKGKVLTDQLVKLQKETILGPEVFENAQTMMGFGFDSSEVLENMKMLGDVSMGNKEKFASLTLAFSQIRAAGRLTGQDLLQLVNAGFNPLEQMSHTTGKSIGRLRDEMAKGNISFAMVQQAFRDATSEGGKFNNMLATIADTPAGKMQQMSGAWEEFKVKAGAAMMPLVTQLMDFAGRIFPMLDTFITPLTNAFNTIGGIVKELTSGSSEWSGYMDTVRAIADNTWSIIKRVWEAVSHIVSRLVEFIKNSALMRDLFSFIGDIMKGIGDIIKWMIDALVWTFDNVVMPIINAVEKIYRFIKGEKAVQQSQQRTGSGTPPAQQVQEQKEAKEVMGQIAKNTADTKAAISSTEGAIKNGGQKVITYNIGKFFDNINISAQTATEGVQDIERVVLEVFGRVLNNGALI